MKRLLIVCMMTVALVLVADKNGIANLFESCIIKWWGDRTGWVTTSETGRTQQARYEAFQAVFYHTPECSGPCAVSFCDNYGWEDFYFVEEGCDGWGDYFRCLGCPAECDVQILCDLGGWVGNHRSCTGYGCVDDDINGSWDVYCGIDSDGDALPDNVDNCSYNANPDQLDTYPPGGNNIGDACDCEGNFDCDLDVDGEDVTTFLGDFGRGQYDRPCDNVAPCNGDFSCDTDVDAEDVTLFLEDFGRSQYDLPCPICDGSPWCSY